MPIFAPGVGYIKFLNIEVTRYVLSNPGRIGSGFPDLHINMFTFAGRLKTEAFTDNKVARLLLETGLGLRLTQGISQLQVI